MKSHMYSYPGLIVLALVGAIASPISAAATVTLDGAVSSNTNGSGTSISVSHTTGTGTDRLMLVGVSWNSGSGAQTISSVTFSYGSGPTVMTNNPVVTRKHASQYRYSAIYSLTNPPSGQSGTVKVTFSGTVGNGIMAGVANFAGVDQTTPLGTTNGADGNSTAPSVTLTGLSGNELVFDNVFQGASSTSQTLTTGSGQTQLWNPPYVANLRAAASTKQATGASVTMSWTAASASYWVITAVPIKPAGAAPTVTINQAANQADPTNTSPINFTVVFSQSVTDFVSSAVSLSGTAGATTANHHRHRPRL
jgi:large repetitive protein